MTPPVVQVSANYPGATALDVATTVAAPIEQQLAGIPGLLYYKSTSSGDGSMSLQVSFDIKRDQDLAAVDVQNQIALARRSFRRKSGATVSSCRRRSPTSSLVGVLTSTDPRYNGEFLSNYSKIYLEDEIKRIPGVGNATTFGNLNFAMNIELDPDKMAQLGVTVSDITAAVNEQNSTNPAGSVGREPAPVGTQLTLPVTTLGRLSTPEEFENIIIRARPDGSVLRISDVGTVRLGARDYGLVGMYNGKPVAPIIVYLRPGANALAVRNAYIQAHGGAREVVPGRRASRGRLRHDAVRHDLDSRSREHAPDRDGARDARRLRLPAELALDAHPAARRAGLDHRHLLRAVGARLHDQPAYALRPHARDRHRRR